MAFDQIMITYIDFGFLRTNTSFNVNTMYALVNQTPCVTTVKLHTSVLACEQFVVVVCTLSADAGLDQNGFGKAPHPFVKHNISARSWLVNAHAWCPHTLDSWWLIQ